MQVTLATTEGKLLEDEFSSVVLPAVGGQLEILPGHTALLTPLDVGLMRVKRSATERGESFVLHGGFALVQADRLYVISEIAERPAEIDANAAATAVTALQQELKTAGLSPEQIVEHNRQIRLHSLRRGVGQKQ